MALPEPVERFLIAWFNASTEAKSAIPEGFHFGEYPSPPGEEPPTRTYATYQTIAEGRTEETEGQFSGASVVQVAIYAPSAVALFGARKALVEGLRLVSNEPLGASGTVLAVLWVSGNRGVDRRDGPEGGRVYYSRDDLAFIVDWRG